MEKQKVFLEFLLLANKKQRQVILRTIDKKQLKALSEIAHNVLQGTIDLSSCEKAILKKYKKTIITLGTKSITRKEKLKTLRRGANAIFHLLTIVGTEPWKR